MRRQPTRPRAIKRRPSPRASLGACALLALLGEISSARAATFVWDGGHNAQSRWTDKANWIGDQEPVTDGSADLVFTGTLRLSNDSNGAWSVNSVTFNNLAGAFTLSGGALTLQGAAVPFALANDDIETQTIQNALITGSAQVWSASNGNLVLSGTVLNNHALTLTGAYNTTLSGAVSGSGSLVKTGSGSLTLSGANSYSGGTTLSAGTLQGTSLSLQGDIATASGASLVFDQSFDGTYSGLVSGSGSLTKSGSGVLTLSGANSFSGGTTISAGTLRLSGGAALSDTGAVVLANAPGATLDLAGSSETIGSLSGGGSLGGHVTLGPGGSLTVGGAHTSTTFAGSLSGSGSLVKTGSGTLTLSGANTYSGGTTVSAGTLQGTSVSLQGDIATASGSSLVFDQSFDGAYSGLVSGSGALTKSGSGLLTLSGANSHSGGTIVSAGGLALGASDALSASGALTLGAGTTLSLGGAYSARVASLSHAGATLDFGTAGTANAFLFDSAGTGSGTLTVLNWTSGADILAFASGASVADAFIENIYFSGIGSGDRGATGVSVSGYSGAWDTIVASAATFSTWDGGGANDHFGTDANWAGDSPPASGPTTKVAFSGSTRISPNLAADFTLNSLKFDSGAAASFTLSTNSGKTLTFAGSVPSLIQASASAQTVAVPVSLTKNTFVEMSGAGDLVLSGAVSGAGGFTVLGSGAGEVVLSGANTYSGSTAINAGTVVLQHGSALGSTASGTSVASGATLRLENTISVGAESLALSGTLRQSSGTNTYAGPISGSGSLVVDGGQLTLSGSSANTYSGDTLVHAGTLVLGKSAGVSAVSGNLTIGSGSNSAHLTLSAAHQISDSSRVTLSSSGSPVFNLAGHNETLGSLASSNSASSVSLGSATLSTGADHSSTSFAGVISGSGSLVKLGSGSFTLSGSNTYSGSTTVSSGTLALTASDRLADGSALALAGGTLSLGGVASERVGVFSYTDGSVLDFGAAGAANSLLFASGGGSTGTLVVRNFTEGVDILGSSVDTLDQSFLDNIFFDGLGVGLGAEYVAGGPVSVSGYTGVFHRIQPIETFTWTGLNNSGGGARNEWIDGANWNKGAPGVNRAIVMTGANYLSHTLGADFSIQSLLFDRQAGAFDIGGANNLTIRGGGIYNDSLYDQTLSTRVTLSANQTWTAATADLAVTGPNLYLNAHTLSVAGAADTLVSALVSDSGGITKNGSGTLTLSHSGNSYSGATLINAGTLLVTADGALGSAAAGTTVRSGGTLALSGGIDYATTESLTLAGSGANAGGALRNLSGDNRYAGSIALAADASLASAAGTLTLSGGLDLATHRATFAGAGDITVSGAVSGAGSLLKTGSGTLALAAANTYAGLTTITGGTLLASHASALGATTGGTVVDDGATLALSGGVSIGAESLTLSGSGAGGIGALRNQSGANVFAGAVTLAADTTLLSASGSLSLTGTLAAGGHALSVDGAGDLTIASTLSGATDLRKSGSGVLAFTADQTFSGEITLSGGTLSLVDSEISVATLRVTAGSVLDFAGSSTLRVGELLLELGTGETLSITRWQDLSDYLLVSHFDGAAYDRPGVPPAHQIVFAAFSGADTRWQSHNNEVTPVPEPSAYGALALGGLAAWSALRRRRPSPNPHRPGAC